ncbi:polypeptide N-acetylgalactosaminyltransferase 18 [Willisornis vidua]|uniref:Polypeptide N-acetylgalactosaminyltransferase 18 n=1 Tax=Willisornis vidua TaxID=1566151 RepID=A0ABQ9D844_9PASS|nr:polypeptide N-acetylgalactosaminyltransferase 18 [Willisornis vidua]
MTNIVCLLYVGWVTNYIASVYVKVQEPISEKKLEEDKGDTLRIIERLDHLENVIKQHIQVNMKLQLLSGNYRASTRVIEPGAIEFPWSGKV